MAPRRSQVIPSGLVTTLATRKFRLDEDGSDDDDDDEFGEEDGAKPAGGGDPNSKVTMVRRRLLVLRCPPCRVPPASCVAARRDQLRVETPCAQADPSAVGQGLSGKSYAKAGSNNSLMISSGRSLERAQQRAVGPVSRFLDKVFGLRRLTPAQVANAHLKRELVPGTLGKVSVGWERCGGAGAPPRVPWCGPHERSMLPTRCCSVSGGDRPHGHGTQVWLVLPILVWGALVMIACGIGYWELVGYTGADSVAVLSAVNYAGVRCSCLGALSS